MKINIIVKANAKKDEVSKEKDIYKVSVKAKAEHNKANIDVIKLLEKYFKKKVRIVKGLKSRKKVVEVFD
jgi:uncharacterized protein (TIGR00251 family)